MITNNRVYLPAEGGVFVSEGDNSAPNDIEQVVVADNLIEFEDPTYAGHQGVNIRNVRGYAVTGNVIIRPKDGVQINGIATGSYGVSNGVVAGNVVEDYGRYGVWLRNKVQGAQICLNRLNALAAETTQDIRTDYVSAVDTDNFIFNNVSSNADSLYTQVQRAYGSGVQYFGNQNGIHAGIGSSTANVVNRIRLAGNAAGAPVQIIVEGGDANADMHLVPKGAGVMRFGTHSAIGAETVTGYITIKDAGGSSRKVAAVS